MQLKVMFGIQASLQDDAVPDETGLNGKANMASKFITAANLFAELVTNSEEAQDAAVDMIDIVIDAGSRILYEKYLEEKLKAYTSRRMLNDSVRVCRWAFLPCDVGETREVQKRNCDIGIEPPPSPIDVWGR